MLCISISVTGCWPALQFAGMYYVLLRNGLNHYYYYRAGFPNKMLYPEFKARYNILGASLVAKAKNDKAAAGAVLDLIKLPAEKFRLGHTKVFFRAGILGEKLILTRFEYNCKILQV